MASVRFSMCLILVLLSVARSKPHPLRPFLQEKTLVESFGTLVEGDKQALFKVGMGREDFIGGQNEFKRESSGGPDPQHHSKNPAKELVAKQAIDRIEGKTL